MQFERDGQTILVSLNGLGIYVIMNIMVVSRWDGNDNSKDNKKKNYKTQKIVALYFQKKGPLNLYDLEKLCE